MPDNITFRIDSRNWIMVCEKFDKILLRANRLGNPTVQPDSGKDKARQIDAEGFVRIRSKREYEFLKS